MKKGMLMVKRMGMALAGILLLAGCAGSRGIGQEPVIEEGEAEISTEAVSLEPKEGKGPEAADRADAEPSEGEDAKLSGQEEPESSEREDSKPLEQEGSEREEPEPPEFEITETDWSKYFDGLEGTAVLYYAADRHFKIHNREQALIQSSPCSTFKIISSLIALEEGIIRPDDSIYAWRGEVFWNEKWNQDIDFRQAFRESCVWYFRRVIDEIGQERMQKTLEKLSYGNCDISDWEGRLNTNNNNRALTGFWIESSLKISPKEQTEVMERIFGENSVFSEETREELKGVMQVTGEEALEDRPEISLFGKTGMGKAQGDVVDAWFTGFAEKGEEKVYFCVHLGRNEGRNMSSALAREIAVRILLEDFCTGMAKNSS